MVPVPLTDAREPEHPRLRWSHFIVGVVSLSALVTLVYANVIFGGATLVSTANASPIDDRWPGRNHRNWHDQGGVWWQWEPAAQFFAKAYRSGELPLWDPTVAGGVNSHVNVTQGQYFPPYVMLLLAGNTPLLRDSYYLLVLLASGVGCVLLLLRNGFHPASAFFMGAAWILGGTMTQNINAFLGQTYATLPWFVLAVDYLLDRAGWRAVGLAGLVIGVCTYSSFLPIVISGFVLVGIQAGVYALLALRSSHSPWRRATVLLAGFAVAIVLGLGIAASILVPLAETQRESARFHAYYTGIGKMAYSWDQVPSLLSPRLFYDVWQTEPYTSSFRPKPFWYSTHFFYVGMAAVLLAALVRRDERARVRRLTWFFAVAAALFFFKLIGLPPFQWIAYLPVFEFLHFIPYFSGAFALAVAGLAACGVEALVTSGVTRRRGLAATAVAAALLGTIPLFMALKGFNAAASARTTMLYFLEVDRVLIVVLGLLVVFFFRMRSEIRGTTAAVLASALLIVELGPLAFERRVPRADVWNERLPEYVRFLKSDPEFFRVHSIHPFAVSPNTFQGLGLSGISSLGVFNQPRYTALIEESFQLAFNSGFIIPHTLIPASRGILDVLNVKYIVTWGATPEEEQAIAAAGFTLAVSDGNFRVLRNPSVWQRAFVTHDYQVVPGTREAIKATSDSASPHVAVLERPPSFPARPEPSTPAQIAAYGPDRVVLRGGGGTPGMLVLLDSYADGWTATVNGEPTSIVPVYGAFRGVEVPRGQWHVEMQYQVPRLLPSAVVSAVSLALALGATFVGRPLARRLALPDAERPASVEPAVPPSRGA